MQKLMMIVVSGFLLAGCAHEPIVDRRGVDEEQYYADLQECRAYAGMVDTTGEVAKGSAIGAAIGASAGAIWGNRHTAEKGAGVGAVTGGARGFEKAEHRKEKVLYNCMRSRGYRIFG